LISQLEKEVTLRFLKTRKKDGFLNIISIFSFIGISLGVAVLIIVMSVMNGFRTELIDKIVGFNPHAVIKFYSTENDIKKLDNSKINKKIKYVIISNDSEGIIIAKDITKGVLLRGYLNDEFNKLSIANNDDFKGTTNLLKNSISIGKELSLNLNLNIGDKVSIMSSSGVQTIVGSLPKQETFVISSIFDSGISDFNQNVAYINLTFLENLFDLEKIDRKLEIYFKDHNDIENHKIELQALYNNDYVYTWADLNQSLFSALKVERNVMFIILSLIIIVAAFNIISGLTIL
jgi:ABC-type transport system, involved in lipoprotein release, permease component